MTKFLFFKSQWTGGFHGVTQKGLPIWIDILGHCDANKLSKTWD